METVPYLMTEWGSMPQTFSDLHCASNVKRGRANMGTSQSSDHLPENDAPDLLMHSSSSGVEVGGCSGNSQNSGVSVVESYEPTSPKPPVRQRRRSRACKNKEEVEHQRMTHIAVERHRRKQMNHHLDVLRSLMPESYAQRGDQASIIGGAIEFVKEAEQILHSLQREKRARDSSETHSLLESHGSVEWNEYMSVGKLVDVKMVGFNTALLQLLCHKRHGLLLQIVYALQSLGLKIMELTISTIDQTVLYSLTLQMGTSCKMKTIKEIAASVQHFLQQQRHRLLDS